MSTLTKRGRRSQSEAEEIANAITHGLGALLSVAALIIMVVQASSETAWHLVGVSVFGICLVMLYTVSCLYHSMRTPEKKRIFRIFDHALIFVLIAGSYTPWLLVNLRELSGWWLFCVIWGLALGGIVWKVALPPRYEKLGAFFYLGMGWLVLFVFKDIQAEVSPAGVRWIVNGGILYSLGVIFFILQRVRFFHAVWHLFVIAGSASHVIAVLYGVIPHA